jgi:hypothetical protein
MVNDGNLKLFDLSLPAKLFPGVFQKYVPPSNLFTTGQFSAQAFGFDAWHTYAIDFGILGACIFILWIFLIIFYLLKVLNRRLILRQSASGVYYALFLWLSLRVLLLPLGDYFLDLAAVMELLWLIILFLLTGIKVSSRIEVQGVSSS